ncbi:hypothetical protein CH63R_03469 [Colletotrichum higginsianum IMI 349063]|uniref:Secreted protein n=2 Tax=Colletotrichum higginsianum TaxID=80884 RepID=A0A1B7YRU4_COLHI|nr:hypothetical protein CH63R_03469 [Colletotrichum higginsianum IMI 349063]OBR14743.1 hypothetical protein CH63R_03469 [Colletotrichum higginsianum IMI 349063]TID01737.1 hypothetical protein CH35J_004833 [Colletotrichum higginsianum]
MLALLLLWLFRPHRTEMTSTAKGRSNPETAPSPGRGTEGCDAIHAKTPHAHRPTSPASSDDPGLPLKLG